MRLDRSNSLNATRARAFEDVSCRCEWISLFFGSISMKCYVLNEMVFAFTRSSSVPMRDGRGVPTARARKKWNKFVVDDEFFACVADCFLYVCVEEIIRRRHAMVSQSLLVEGFVDRNATQESEGRSRCARDSFCMDLVPRYYRGSMCGSQKNRSA